MDRRLLLLLALLAAVALALWALRGAGDGGPAADVPAADRTRPAVEPRVAQQPEQEPAGREPVVVDERPAWLGIRGRVEWPDGVAVAGASVRQRTDDPSSATFETVVSTPRGDFRARVPAPFDGELVAELGSLRSAPVRVAGAGGEVGPVVLRLESMPTLRGVLVDPWGRGTRGDVTIIAVSGAAMPGLGPAAVGRTVGVHGGASLADAVHRVRADENGLFRGFVEPGVALRIEGTSNPYARSGIVTVEVPPGGIDVTVRLVELLDLTGAVVRPDGTPWDGLEIWALDHREALRANDHERAPRASSDALGRFVLGGVAGLPRVELMLARDDAAQVHVRRDIDPRVEPLRIVIDDAELAVATLRVRAVGIDGALLERFLALAYRRGEDARLWPTGVDSAEDGVARIDGFPPGVEIAVVIKTGQRTLAVHRSVCAAGENAITVRVEPSGALEVRAAGARRVDLLGPDGLPEVAWQRVRDGAVRWDALVPGEYDVSADFGDGDAREARATVLPGSSATVVLDDGR